MPKTKIKKFIYLFALALLFTSCDYFKSADYFFAQAEKMRTDGNPQGALLSLDKITSKFADHSRAPEAQYLKAEILYRDLQNYSKSVAEYERFAIQFPEDKKVPFSIFMQGFIFANELMSHDSAKVYYKKFIDRYPNHEMIESVKFELKYLGIGINEIPELKHLTE